MLCLSMVLVLTVGSTVKSFFDVSSLFAQAMLQDSMMVLKCKLSQLLGHWFCTSYGCGAPGPSWQHLTLWG